VTYHDIMAPAQETVGFPIFNPTFRGVKHCFTYITEIFIVAKNYSVVKIDHCNNNQMTRWNEPGVWMSEPYFIDDPQSDKEDDGVIMMSVFDDKINTNRFLIIDAKTMKTVSDTTLPLRLPMMIHSTWYPK
jgi:carotenoid cleavage dioxygenase-like enzyme